MLDDRAAQEGDMGLSSLHVGSQPAAFSVLRSGICYFVLLLAFERLFSDC